MRPEGIGETPSREPRCLDRLLRIVQNIEEDLVDVSRVTGNQGKLTVLLAHFDAGIDGGLDQHR